MNNDNTDIHEDLLEQFRLLSAQQAARDQILSDQQTARDKVLSDQIIQLTSQNAEQREALLSLLADKDKQIDNLTSQLEELTSQLAWFNRKYFGKTSERHTGTDDLPSLFDQETMDSLLIDADSNNNDTNSDPEEEKGLDIAAHKRLKSKREIIPPNAPRIKTVIEPDNIPQGARRIGEDITEILEITPGKLWVRQIIRPKYAIDYIPQNNSDSKTINDDSHNLTTKVIIAPLPPQVINKSKAGASLLSYLIVSKYVDHLPIYRINKIFERSDFKLSDSTMCGWLSKVGVMLGPLYELLKQKVLEQNYLHIDETTINVLKSKDSKEAKKGYFWAYMAPELGALFFDYNESRAGRIPEKILTNFSGTIQTDGYQPYKTIARKLGLEHIGCMAHARRKFKEALSNDPERAKYALLRIKELYAIERKIADLDDSEKLQIRQIEAKPILDMLYEWLIENRRKVLPKRLIGKAISYALGQWECLKVYIESGKYNIDNNLVENAIRPIAIGRKNYLFCGSPAAADNTVIFYSFMATCKRNDINPMEWLTDILPGMEERKISELEMLLPIKGKWSPKENDQEESV